MIHTWPELRAFVLCLDLPQVTVGVPWGTESLKARGNLCCRWSPCVDAARKCRPKAWDVGSLPD